MGNVTARKNVKWFIPVWLWFVSVVWIELQKLSLTILFITFFPVTLASMVPFFCRRIGLIRWWVFGWLFPVFLAVVVLQCLRSFIRS